MSSHRRCHMNSKRTKPKSVFSVFCFALFWHVYIEPLLPKWGYVRFFLNTFTPKIKHTQKKTEWSTKMLHFMQKHSVRCTNCIFSVDNWSMTIISWIDIFRLFFLQFPLFSVKISKLFIFDTVIPKLERGIFFIFIFFIHTSERLYLIISVFILFYFFISFGYVQIVLEAALRMTFQSGINQTVLAQHFVLQVFCFVFQICFVLLRDTKKKFTVGTRNVIAKRGENHSCRGPTKL